MSLVAKAKPSKFSVLDADNYPARVCQVVDLGIQPQKPFQGEEKPPIHQIMVTYELGTEFLPDENGEPDEEKPRWISETFPLYPLTSDRAKSTLRYRVLDPSKSQGGDWSKMVGRQCLVTVVQYEKDGTTRNAVGGIAGLMKGFEAPALVNEPRVFLMDEPDMEVFDAFPDWLKEKLVSNLGFEGSKLQAALTGSTTTEEESDEYNDVPV